MKFSIIIPVYNEKETVGEIINRVDKLSFEKEIIVVDDCSTDGTTEGLRRLEREKEIRIIYKKRREGRGAALRDGFEIATGDYFITQDADLELMPEELYKLVKVIREKKAPVVYGSRFLGNPKKMTFVQYYGNKILNLLTSIILRHKITDLATGHTAFQREIIRNLSIKSKGFDFEPEITCKLIKKGYKILEVPVDSVARRKGKKLSYFKDGIITFYSLFKHKISRS